MEPKEAMEGMKRVRGILFAHKQELKAIDFAIETLEKLANGKLVEPVFCSECRYAGGCAAQRIPAVFRKNGYCSNGERREPSKEEQGK